MFNQELSNREKETSERGLMIRTCSKMSAKLDEAMHRPDALVPADTKGGTRRISEGIGEFKVGEFGGTVNLIDWITGTLGRKTREPTTWLKEASRKFPKSLRSFCGTEIRVKRLSWQAQPFQETWLNWAKDISVGLKTICRQKWRLNL